MSTPSWTRRSASNHIDIPRQAAGAVPGCASWDESATLREAAERRTAVLSSVANRQEMRSTPWRYQAVHGRRITTLDSSDSYEHSYALEQMKELGASLQEGSGLLGRRVISFSSLIAHRTGMVDAKKLTKSAAANEKSALVLFRECFRLSEDSPVSPWLTNVFVESLKKVEEFAATLRDGRPRLSAKTLPAYLTHMRTLHNVAEELEGVPMTFGEAFDLAVRRWIGEVPGRRINRLVEMSGAPRRQIVRWRKPDANPRAMGETLALVGNLERVMSLRPGALASHLVLREGVNGDDESGGASDQAGK